MAVNEPTWTYGRSEVYNSSGETTDPDDAWSYGQNQLQHEYAAAGGYANSVIGISSPAGAIGVSDIASVIGI